MHGLLLAFQFFTVVPIRKELPMGKKQITMMFGSLPLIGLFIGAIMSITYFISTSVLAFSPLLTAIFLVLTGLIMTGGLHIDGWADTADAFFSYQSIEKRHEILEDPRLGAFGTMALIVIIITKIGLIYESILQGLPIIPLVLLIPFLTRIGFNIVFAITPPAKETGLGAFFKARLHARHLVILSGCWLAVLAVMGIMFTGQTIVILALIVIMLLSVFCFRSWTCTHFGGMSGDVSGAYIEGMEVVLWLTLLCLL